MSVILRPRAGKPCVQAGFASVAGRPHLRPSKKRAAVGLCAELTKCALDQRLKHVLRRHAGFGSRLGAT